MLLVGDVRRGMQTLDTPGTAEVIALLPANDATRVPDTVLRPVLTVAHVPGNSALLDDLSENVSIGAGRGTNLKMALLALIQTRPPPSAVDVDALKRAASALYASSFRQRALRAQREAAPRVLLFVAAALICLVLPSVVDRGAAYCIEVYAMRQGTDIMIAQAAVVRQKQYASGYGALRRMVAGVKATGTGTGTGPGARVPLMPGDVDGVQHALTLVATLDKGALARYDRAELQAFRAYLDVQADRNASLDKSLDAATHVVVALMTAHERLLVPACGAVRWCGKVLVPAAVLYYVFVMLRSAVETAVHVSGLSYLRHVWNGTLLAMTVAAVASAGRGGGQASLLLAVGLCVSTLALWRGKGVLVPSR
jgi:hypothetical protein